MSTVTPLRTAAALPVLSMIIRGQVITDHLTEVGGRGGDLRFLTPEVNHYLERLPLGNPRRMADLYAISFQDILDYLVELGQRLDIRRNAHLQWARESTYGTSPLTPALVDASYAGLPEWFARESMTEAAEQSIGIEYLEGWVPRRMLSGATVRIRCFGARCLHIVAGNAPAVSALSILRNALLRSDAIIKAPSNDPFTAWAIARTMCDMAPDHPVTKHLSVAYWRGGDTAVEQALYQPHHIEKIIAWGGFASVRHVTRYIQPGLELISLDPKRSTSIIGAEAFATTGMMQAAAVRVATDVGATNQNGCVNARVVYVLSGTDAAGLAKANALGQLVYAAMLALPGTVSTRPKRYNRDLKDLVVSLAMDDEWYRVIGGRDDEGAVIVSQLPEAVNFATALTDRTVNIVPIDTLDEFLGTVNAYTQTVGVFPEPLKDQLVDQLPLHGAQRIVSLGYAVTTVGTNAGPHDAIEPMRRMGKWILDEICTPETVAPLWEQGTAGTAAPSA